MAMESLQNQLESLSSEVATLREEGLVLRDFLDDLGLTRRESFQARLHRHRFDSKMENSDFKPSASFEDLLSIPAFVDNLCKWGPADAWSKLTQSLAHLVKHSPQLYVIGGLGDESRLVQRFDPAAGVWNKLAPMSQGRAHHSVSAVAGKLYVVGGKGELCEGTLKSAECFVPDAGVWETLPPMSQRRSHHSASVIAGELYVVGGDGGCGSHNPTLDSVECFDHVAGAWRRLGSISEKRSSHSASVLAGKLYVVGGKDVTLEHYHFQSDEYGSERMEFRDGQTNYLESVERFDPVTGAWETLTPMSQRRSTHVAAVIAGKLYVAGACEDGWSVERFDPIQNIWETLQQMSHLQTVPSHVSACVIAGMLYLVGGEGFNSKHCAASVKRFNPEAHVWETLAPMSIQCQEPSASVIAGKLYVCESGSVQRFDPKAGVWEALAPISGAPVKYSVRVFAGTDW